MHVEAITARSRHCVKSVRRDGDKRSAGLKVWQSELAEVPISVFCVLLNVK